MLIDRLIRLLSPPPREVVPPEPVFCVPVENVLRVLAAIDADAKRLAEEPLPDGRGAIKVQRRAKAEGVRWAGQRIRRRVRLLREELLAEISGVGS